MKDTKTLLPHVKLHLNVKHPSFEDCYSFGYDSSTAELSEEDNPFAAHTRESDYWLEGWWDAFYEHAPKHTLEDDLTSKDKVPHKASNDSIYAEVRDNFIMKILEISGMLAVSAFVGYQLIDLVA